MNTFNPTYAHKCLHQPSCMRGSRVHIFCEAVFTEKKHIQSFYEVPSRGCLSSAFLYQMSFRYLHWNLTTYSLQTHNCWPSYSLLRFTTITDIHRAYSLQTISKTAKYNIFLSCWQHYAVATKTRQIVKIFNCNGNSKLTQNCPFLFAVKLAPLLHIQ